MFLYNRSLKIIGVAHGDEMTYEFYSNILKNLPQAGSPAERMTRIFTTLVTNFAKDGYVSATLISYNANFKSMR